MGVKHGAMETGEAYSTLLPCAELLSKITVTPSSRILGRVSATFGVVCATCKAISKFKLTESDEYEGDGDGYEQPAGLKSWKCLTLLVDTRCNLAPSLTMRQAILSKGPA